MSRLTDTDNDLKLMSLPHAVVRVETSVKLNGAEIASQDIKISFIDLNNDVNSLAVTDLFSLWNLKKDGADDITTTITLTGLADVVPMRWEWDYDEAEISTGTVHNLSDSWDFDGVSATRTFSASTNDRVSQPPSQNLQVTDFKLPH